MAFEMFDGGTSGQRGRYNPYQLEAFQNLGPGHNSPYNRPGSPGYATPQAFQGGGPQFENVGQPGNQVQFADRPDLPKGYSTSAGYSRSVQDGSPWLGQQPHALDVYDLANENARTRMNYFGGPLSTGMSGLGMGAQQAAGRQLQGGPGQGYFGQSIGGGHLGQGAGAGLGYYDDALSGANVAGGAGAGLGFYGSTGAGGFLQQGAGAGLGFYDEALSGSRLDQSSNPALRGLADRGAADILRQYSTVAAPSVYHKGNIGSGAEQNRMAAANIGLGDALGRNYDNVFGADYGRERGYMEQARMAAAGQFGSQYGRERGLMENAQMAQAQQYGSQFGQERGFTEQARRAAAGQFGSQYGRERGFQQDSAGMYGSEQRANIGQAQGIGAYGRGVSEEQRAAQQAGFDWTRDEPWLRQQRFQQGIMGAGYAGNVSYSESQNADWSRAPKNNSGGTSTANWLGLGIGALGLFSSRAVKDHVDDVNGEASLDAMRNLQIAIWKYKPEVSDKNGDRAHHMGPYAEDFAQILGLGDGHSIAFIDMIGFTMAAMQGAAQRIEALGNRIAELESLVLPKAKLAEA
jgi:hypothetical protein